MADENTRARLPVPATNPTQPRAQAPGARPVAYSVVVVQGPAAGARVGLEREVVVGRDPRCELPIASGDVSRRHARIVPDEGGHRVIDMGSTNGTWVNGRPVTSRKLVPGDRIELGSCVLRYLRQGEADAEDLSALADLARRDSLTGLANRRAFEEALRREVARARRSGLSLGLVVMDIDNFKQVNDTHGHAAGDLVLAEVAARAQRALRVEDLLARVGGEELAALLPAATLAAAAEVAERIRRAVSDPAIPAGGAAVSVTVSLGCAVLGAEERAEAFWARADARLYDAKRGGRDRVAHVPPGREPGDG
ncbi:MAG TPA: GGDEF domain-containing protein [Anaeromyxobacter sp.]|nr:GGDEF domain-containing protein [Anaeromyxobacter sp.]